MEEASSDAIFSSNILSYTASFHKISCPYTPEQNGVAERKHRHITDTTLKLIFQALISLRYWVDVILNSCLSYQQDSVNNTLLKKR